MPAFWVVEHLNVIEHISASILPSAVDLSPDPLPLQQLENAFRYRVVMAVTTSRCLRNLGRFKPSLVRYKKDKVTPVPGSYSSGINRAWALEKKLVDLTGYGPVDWSPEQIAGLRATGKVKGFTGRHINNAAKAPEWEGDPRNIVFLSNTPNGGGHLNSNQGHRGSWQNPTEGRLIDRREMIKQWERYAGC